MRYAAVACGVGARGGGGSSSFAFVKHACTAADGPPLELLRVSNLQRRVVDAIAVVACRTLYSSTIYWLRELAVQTCLPERFSRIKL